jgi:hypothetical protein
MDDLNKFAAEFLQKPPPDFSAADPACSHNLHETAIQCPHYPNKTDVP